MKRKGKDRWERAAERIIDKGMQNARVNKHWNLIELIAAWGRRIDRAAYKRGRSDEFVEQWGVPTKGRK